MLLDTWFPDNIFGIPGDEDGGGMSAPGCSGKNKYIQQAYLNGKPLSGPWFSHTDLMSGGELKLVMGPLPEKNWGTGPQSLHPFIQP